MDKIIRVKKIGNSEIGNLSFFEAEKDIPFSIKRIYYVYDTPINTQRGKHAHKDLYQALWCPYGKIRIDLDNGNNEKSYILDSPEKILLVGPGIWREMYWQTEGSVLCVAASECYDEDDYIRDYNEFLKYVKERYWQNENQL